MSDGKCKHCARGCKYCDARFATRTPYAWFHFENFNLIYHDVWEELIEGQDDWVPLYTEPKREWVGLTDEEVAGLWEMAQAWNAPKHFYLLVEAKLKEKNQ